MNLGKKKILAAKTLGVGKNRILFVHDALNEIKEAITKQDIKSLHEEGAIQIRPIRGRKKVKQRKRKVGWGKIKMNVRHRKRDYIILTRKLRAAVGFAKNAGTISKEMYYDIRKKIKNRHFKSGGHLKEYIGNFVKPIVKDRNFSPKKFAAFPNKSTTKWGNINVVDHNENSLRRTLKTSNDTNSSIKSLEAPASKKSTKPLKKKTTRSKK
ncbi:MAG: 50S ribosomal protein L19e [Nanoarchaeota archaeon]